MRTDTYQWSIKYTGGIPVTGTFLDGTPWIYPNGATLTFFRVSPQEKEIVTEEGFGLVQRTVINPDFNKFKRDVGISGASYDDNFTVVSCVGEDAGVTATRVPFDFRGGAFRNEESTTIGRYYDPTQGITQSDGFVSGVTLEVGDMIVTQTAHTGDFINGSAEIPWTESWACLTVVGSTLPSNSFRPPVNWDPTDKANRPILTEGNTFSEDQLTYPNYNLSSDTRTWTDTTIAYSESLEERLGTLAPYFVGAIDNSSFRGTLKSQALTKQEYGGYQAIDEERMMICCFDPNVSGATQDLFRRVVTQRGIDAWGALYSSGKLYGNNGYHGGEWNPRVYFAYAVTQDSRIFDTLNFAFGNTGNNTYKEYALEYPNGLKRIKGSHETEQASVGHPLCSYRHFDMNVTESGLSGGVPYIIVDRPIDKRSGGSRRPAYHLSVSSFAYAGKWWGWSDNNRIPKIDHIRSSYVRTRGISGGVPIGGVSRIIDGNHIVGGQILAGSTADPDQMLFYLQTDVVNGSGGGGITGCDMSNSVVETRNNTLCRTITYVESNTSSPAGKQAYTYSVISHTLSNYLISKSLGFTNLPFWGQAQKEKAELLLTTNEGKMVFIENQNSVYNLGTPNSFSNYNTDNLYHAICRQEIAAGVSLAPTPLENFAVDDTDRYRDSDNWFDLPGTMTWEEIFEIPNVDNGIYTKAYTDTNNSRDFYSMSTGQVVGSPSWCLFQLGITGTPELYLHQSSGLTWDNFTGTVYAVPSGATFAYGLTLESTTATGTGDTNWNATWVFDDSSGLSEALQLDYFIPDYTSLSVVWTKES